MDEYTDSSLALCAHHCVVRRFCVAVNYRTNVRRKEPNCQLTNTTKQNFEENASQMDRDWTFRKVNLNQTQLVSI